MAAVARVLLAATALLVAAASSSSDGGVLFADAQPVIRASWANATYDFTCTQALFGPALPADGLAGVLVRPPGGDRVGCGAYSLPANTTWIVLVDRGDCSFGDKAQRAYAAGAAGVIITNNLDQLVTMTLADDDRALGLQYSAAVFSTLTARQRLDGFLSSAASADDEVTVTLIPSSSSSSPSTLVYRWSPAVLIVMGSMMLVAVISSVFAYRRRRRGMPPPPPRPISRRVLVRLPVRVFAGSAAESSSVRCVCVSFVSVCPCFAVSLSLFACLLPRGVLGLTRVGRVSSWLTTPTSVRASPALSASRISLLETNCARFRAVMRCDGALAFRYSAYTAVPVQFHKDCIDPWLSGRSSSCPMCKASVMPRRHSRGTVFPSPGEPTHAPAPSEAGERRGSTDSVDTTTMDSDENVIELEEIVLAPGADVPVADAPAVVVIATTVAPPALFIAPPAAALVATNVVAAPTETAVLDPEAAVGHAPVVGAAMPPAR
jgi:hypothetical protein